MSMFQDNYQISISATLAGDIPLEMSFNVSANQIQQAGFSTPFEYAYEQFQQVAQGRSTLRFSAKIE